MQIKKVLIALVWDTLLFLLQFNPVLKFCFEIKGNRTYFLIKWHTNYY